MHKAVPATHNVLKIAGALIEYRLFCAFYLHIIYMHTYFHSEGHH